MTKLLSLIVSIAMVGCGYDTFSDFNSPLPSLPAPTTTIAELNSLYKDKATIINRDCIIHGYVSSSDRGNNFFKSIVVQDHSGAIEIMAGLYNLHNIYPVGQRVLVSTFGLTLGKNDGMIQLGTVNRSNTGREVDYMGHRSIVDRYVWRDAERTIPEAQSLTIGSLTQQHVGMLIKISNLIIYDRLSPTTWGDSASGTTSYRRFSDADANSIYVSCSAYANFADREIPQVTISLTGILYKATTGSLANKFILKIREMNDVQMD